MPIRADRNRNNRRTVSMRSGRSGRQLNVRRPHCDLLEERTLLTTYEIGPGQSYTTLGAFPWSSLKPGDTVDILWQSAGYHEKLLLSESGTASAPINIVGVPGPAGQEPVIDGENATTNSQFQYFYNPIQEDSVVVIQRSASQPSTYEPSYINISGLEIKDGYDAYKFTDNTGKTQTYAAFAASVYIDGASNITIENSTLDSSGLGLFVLTNNGLTSSNIMVEGNYIYGNGVPGQYLEHNVYSEADGITYQYNDFGPLRAGSDGAQLKDRSAGAVIRYNYFAPAAAILDLVDAEDANDLASLPSYTDTYVYGNILDNTGADQTGLLVHFGGDSGNTAIYRPDLYFYDNTVVNLANQSVQWRTTMFELDTNSQNLYAYNNIFYNGPSAAGSAATNFEWMETEGEATFGPNWVSPGSLPSLDNAVFDGTITGTANFVSPASNNPGFVSLSGDNYQLSSTSSAIGIAGTLNSSWPAVTEEYVAPASETARSSVADDGAYQAGPAVPAVTGETPATNATNVAISSGVTATFNEAVTASTITFTLKNSAGTAVADSVAYNSSTNSVTLTPSAALAYSTTYTATISGAQSSSGVAMTAPFSWSFTTDPTQPSVSSHTPASGATGVAVSMATLRRRSMKQYNPDLDLVHARD